MISARRVVIDGLSNTRDLGGFITEAGKITKFNVFFRSESLFYLDSSNVTMLEKYGITNCIDIHGQVDDQNRLHPFQDSQKFEYRCIPILSDLIKHKGTKKDNFQEADWVDVNIRMLETNKQWVKEVITACADAKSGTIIHCRTGKSRTSLICMILMMLAKVPSVDIVAEFATTEIYMKKKYDEFLKNSFHSEGFYKSSAFILDRTIEHINNKYIDVVGYLKSCEVSDITMRKIIDKFVCEIDI